MSKESEGIMALKAELDAGELPEEALGFISAEYGLNPILLERKFKEQYGVKPHDWIAATLVDRPTPASADNTLDLKSMTPIQRANEMSKSHFLTPSEQQMVGKRFTVRKWPTNHTQAYLFVALDKKKSATGLEAVNADTGKLKRFRINMWDRIMEQLA